MAEKELDAVTLLQKLSTAFNLYVRPAPEAEEAQNHLFHVVAAANAQNQLQFGDGLRAEYLEAVRANVAARHRYEEAASSSSSSSSSQAGITDQLPRSASDRTTLLNQRLEFLRLKKRNAQLTTLNDEINAIKITSGPASVQMRPTTIESMSASLLSANGQGIVAESIMQSIQALEMAVVHAKHEAAQQTALLDRARSAIQQSRNVIPERHVAAMLAVRKELTRWLEEALDKCQEDTGVLNDEGVDDAPETEEDLDQQVIAQYERYIDARRHLLSTIASLRASMPERETSNIEGGNESTEQPLTSHGTDLVNAVEKRLLPSLQQQRMSYAHLAFVDEQLQKESTTTINMLDRLSDESQLLQAFPILADSGRFIHAASAFGNKQQQDAGAGIKDEVSNRLNSWVFAAGAADVASSGAIAKHLKQGREAVDEVCRGLAGVRLLKEARA